MRGFPGNYSDVLHVIEWKEEFCVDSKRLKLICRSSSAKPEFNTLHLQPLRFIEFVGVGAIAPTA